MFIFASKDPNIMFLIFKIKNNLIKIMNVMLWISHKLLCP